MAFSGNTVFTIDFQFSSTIKFFALLVHIFYYISKKTN